ncbi:hypothetical protein BJ165DRAFT_1594963 [Panaeolus papilionaceus]|nr:hypothetical protein BJ165DRAFT_1594963 [Panaeolus papilionaceus]
MESKSAPADTKARSSESRLPAFIYTCKDFVFKPVLKLSALRLAVLACIATIATGVLNFDILRDTAFKFWFVPRILDVVLLLAEIAGWGLTIVLLYLLLCRAEAIIGGANQVGSTLLEPFSILDDIERGERKDIPVNGCPAACSMLLGRSIWLNRFPGEGDAIKLMRGAMAGGFVAALIGYAVISLVVQPVRETALIPIVESRGKAIPWGGDNQIEDPAWNFVFLRILAEHSPDTVRNPDAFHNAVSVTRLIDPSRLNGQSPSTLSCVHSPGTLSKDNDAIQMIRVHCPSLQVDETGSLVVNSLPDLLITVDFTHLGTFIDSQQYDLAANVPEVFLGLTQNTDYLTASTKPFPLPAGVNYLASVSLDLRKVLRHRVLSALGMFEATDAFWMPTVEHIVPDPLTRQAASILPDSVNMSSFRLYVPYDPSEIRIVQESREKTILAGMSAVGGLWTLLAGGFGLFFGTKLIQIFLNNKALSIFSFVQQQGRGKIAEEYRKLYPRIQSDMSVDQEDRGVLALLADYMIDLDLFREPSESTNATAHVVKTPGSAETTEHKASSPQTAD